MAVAGLILIVLFYFSWVHFDARLGGMETRLNTDNLTPADYSLMLSNLPVETMSEEEITEAFTRDMLNVMPSLVKDPVSIFRIVYSYDITEFTKLSEKRLKLKREKARLRHINSPKHNKEKLALKEVEKELDNLLKLRKLKRLRLGFVTFNYTIADDVLEKYKPSILTALCNISKYKMKGNNVIVEEAPEPEDVRWENLSYTRVQRIVRAIFNWFITIFVLGICLFANIFISRKSVIPSIN